MRRFVVALVVALAAAVGGPHALGAQSMSVGPVPSSGITALTLESAVGSTFLGSGERVADGPTVSTTILADGLTLSAATDDGLWTTTLRTKAGGPFTPGRHSINAISGVTFAMNLGARSCPSIYGGVTIHAVAYAADGTLSSLAATYDTYCNEPHVGEIRYNSDVEFERFGAVRVGETSPTRSITVTPAVAATYGTVTVSNTSTFKIVGDSCSGAAVGAGSSCIIKVAARPTVLHAIDAILTIPTTSGPPAEIVSLTVNGVRNAEGAYQDLAPTRLLDTRSAVGVSTRTPAPAGSSTPVMIAGRGGAPASGVRAVVLNVTVTQPASGGYVTAYPDGTARPVTSSLNFARGWTRANLVTVKVGGNGRVTLYTSTTAHLVADLVGVYLTSASTPAEGASGGYLNVEPERVVDTRDGTWGGPLPGGSELIQALDYGETLSPAIRAVVVNVTATKPQAGGYLTAFDGSSDMPATSTLNFTRGATVPNMAVIPTSTCVECADDGRDIPMFAIFNGSASPTDVIVDIVGVMDDDSTTHGSRFRALDPVRIVDSRTSLRATRFGWSDQQVVQLPAPHITGSTRAIVANTTVVRATTSTFLTVWPDGYHQPPVSNLNAGAGQTVANMTITGIATADGPLAMFRVFNQSCCTDVLMDLAGTMEDFPTGFPDAAIAGRTNTDDPLQRTDAADAPSTLVGQPAGKVRLRG